jgi:hypothetical protein
MQEALVRWLAEEDKPMKVFISWSGPRSQAIAQTLHTWLKDVIQTLAPWISVEDIDKGQQWGRSLAEELESTHAGVICLTPENLTAPWLLFEAGALSKLYQEARVCTYLIDMPYADVPPGPFSEFQHTLAIKEDTHRMVRSLNATIPGGQGRLTEPQLNRAFEHCWPELQQCLETLPEPQEPIPPPRKTDDMLQEVLEIVRSLVNPVPRSVLPVDQLSRLIARLRSRQDYRSVPNEEADEIIQKLREFELEVGQHRQQALNQASQTLNQTLEEVNQTLEEVNQTMPILSELRQWLSKPEGTEPEKIIIPEASTPPRRKKPTSKGRHPPRGKPRA